MRSHHHQNPPAARPRKTSRTHPPAPAPNYASINQALENQLDLAWTKANQQAIRARVGTVEFQKIEEIIAFTSNQDAWLQDGSISSAADKVAGNLSQHYPPLSPLAIFKIINQATCGWR